MHKQSQFLFVVLGVLSISASQTLAQTPKSARTLLEGWDKNKNGLLEESEIPASARRKFQTLAKRQGINLDKGMPISQLMKGDGAKLRKNARNGKKKIANGQTDGDDVADRQNVGEPKPERPTEQSTSRAKEFGDSRPLKRTTGFGPSEPEEATTAASSEEASSEAPPKKNEDRGAAQESREQKRLRFLAKSMLAQHDSNKNGRLEKREWTRLRGNPATSDGDGDGVLTVEELERHLAGFAVREKEPRASRRPNPTKRPASPSARKTYRFLTPHERLPQGLPDWFTDKDQNRDGQLSLREYASRLSSSELNAFRAFDLNNDGFVVAKEYLKSTD